MSLNRGLYLGLKDFEAHLSLYLPGSLYKKHIDQFTKIKHRIIFCILYLNYDWKKEDCGHLRIYHEEEDGKEAFVDIMPEAGTSLCFRSDKIYHEVLPANRKRFGLTGWLKKEQII